MSSWRTLAFLCACAATMGAQDRAAYQSRVDMLTRRYQSAHARHQAVLDSTSVRAPHDTLVVGPLRVAMLTPDYTPHARRAADSALWVLRPLYGRALDALSRHTLQLRVEQPDGNRRLELVLALIDAQGRETRARWGQVDDAVLFANFRDVIVQVLSDAALYPASTSGGFDPAVLRAWVRSDFPVDSPRTTDYRVVRADLLTSPVTLARRCHDGDIAACRTGLGIDVTTDPATQWFDSAGRVQFIRRDSADFRRVFERGQSPVVAMGEGCLRGRDADCIAVLRDFPSPGLPEPIPVMARLQLLRFAISLGGAGAMERATMTPGPVDARLAAAAGVPVDSLVGMWIGRVQSSDHGSEDMSLAIALSSAFWIVLSFGLATRSSRWR